MFNSTSQSVTLLAVHFDYTNFGMTKGILAQIVESAFFITLRSIKIYLSIQMKPFNLTGMLYRRLV